MATRATFSGLESYKLSGVRMTDKDLGHGAYATVKLLEFGGLKCAGKKIHELLLKEGNTGYAIKRFEEECHILSQLRHPNIVQFLGVYFPEGTKIPLLVMELLHAHLTACIERYHPIPQTICYSILHDVALGLCYLHSKTPPIIHRDLSSNNVLLTTNMTAKISDLGVARILNLTPLQVSRMTQTPGTPAYMPPEVMVANPKYSTSVDDFSFGIMMIHLFSGKWPEPQIGPNRFENGQLIPVTEAERRAEFLLITGSDHPLMDLILKCISNDIHQRVHSNELVQKLAMMVEQFPASFSNKLEMLSRVQKVDEEKEALLSNMKGKDDIFRQKEEQLSRQNDEIREKVFAKEEEIDRLKVVHSSEIEQLRLKIADADTRLMLSSSELTTQIEAHKLENQSLKSLKANLEQEVSAKDTTIKSMARDTETKMRALKDKDATISGLNEQLTRTRTYLAKKQPFLQVALKWKKCADLPKGICYGQSVVIDNKVYCSRGSTTMFESGDDYLVHCYDTSLDKWSTLPPVPVYWFGLGQLNGKLLAVGGRRKDASGEISETYTFDDKSKKWKRGIPNMPTARSCPVILNIDAALIVAGGVIGDEASNAVEIFKPDTSQWYTTESLSKPCGRISLVADDSMCYALGINDDDHHNGARYASFNDLLSNALPAGSQSTFHKRRAATSAWKALPNTPANQPTAAIIAGSILAIGGDRLSDEGGDAQEIYLYSSSASAWIYFSDLPIPLSGTTVVSLSGTEILVIGGWNENKVKSVYKGTFSIK